MKAGILELLFGLAVSAFYLYQGFTREVSPFAIFVHAVICVGLVSFALMTIWDARKKNQK